jgi:hypothetical protein
VGVCGQAQTESHYQRLQRFFRQYEVDEIATLKQWSLCWKFPGFSRLTAPSGGL